MLDPSTTSRTRAWVEVRLDRLRENAAAAQRAIGSRAGLVPMIKAEAYGLGMDAVAAALGNSPEATGPWAFGVAAVSEGERLRASGWSGRILVFSPTSAADFAIAGRLDLTLCLSDVNAARRLALLAAELRKRLPFHLEIDTGIGRAGLPWRHASEWGPEIASIATDRLRWEGTFTHFHSSDEPDLRPTDEQWSRFQQAVAALPDIEPAPLLHVANSGAIFRRKGFGCDLARPGIYLYGGRAGPDVIPLPVVSVRARVVLVREVEAGATAGYGATYRAAGSERWATLSIGYGDGIPRALAAGGSAIIRGAVVQIIGRVSMDMITVDVSSVPDVRVGDVATLIGEDGPERIELDDVAARCDTISYEILTRLGTRLPRVYLDGEQDLPLAG